ncbi:MAG TPA: hypothetical protein VFE41_23330 [Acetobacteraceae bacterium]|jgi:hypothetical protein|nr:hypothetical protein [Acetobacteraceae bacterium]
MATVKSDTTERHPTEGGEASDLAVIRGQTRETLELLRRLVALMLPKEDGDGPNLEELIAALVAQQREMLLGIQRVHADLAALFAHIDGAAGSLTNGGGTPSGGGRA